ncbi:MAG: DUF3108 domain-containing protein, partial [Pseudomonadota bacterium]
MTIQTVGAAALLGLLSPGAFAQTEAVEHESLQPYEAVYKTATSGLSIKLKRSLSMDDNGDCRLIS